ncbi:bifunctional 5,10-methylene-tetrahydrofolate dehydrogenase/5,10-methylene-tetrahydrofolate cyclohydrolase, partial [Nonlabens mediterrranea]|nr:bifunctional 5,10-methylene-tetrahydrofolate dehydrogenase/5,10-methylene-tetrahydrofolate cyclohydrolase [Nonlabens mediterrranea]
MIILDGKKTSNDIKNEITEIVQEMKNNGEKVP